jgi:hypothetical protein
MRLALQKKRWIEMQLHEVVRRTPCFHSRFHLAPHIAPLHSIQDIRDVPAADRQRRNQRNARIRSAARCRYMPPAISFRQTHALALQNPKSAVDSSNPAVCVPCFASHAICSSSRLGHRPAPSRQSLSQGTVGVSYNKRGRFTLGSFVYRT